MRKVVVKAGKIEVRAQEKRDTNCSGMRELIS